VAGKRYNKDFGKTGYLSDVCDEEWAFSAPYLTLMKKYRIRGAKKFSHSGFHKNLVPCRGAGGLDG